MKIVFISVPTFEPWDWTNPDTQGIGGSETSHIEMAQRLAGLGHEIISYAPTPYLMRTDPAGVVWKTAEKMAFEDNPDLWIVYRAPHVVDQIPAGAPVWLICQDVDYRDKQYGLTPERAARFTRIVALCRTHAQYLRAVYPAAADRVCISSNGIKAERIRQILTDPPERNPHRLMYASSPDRGMEYLLEIFPRVREMIPDLELHIYYGFDNIEKVIARMGEKSRVGRNTERLRRLLEQPGVTFHGRMGQPELLHEWFKAGIWCHPSNFTETSCITSMDAQACGAIPITSPLWAVDENVKFGRFIEGNVRNEVVRSRFTLELFRLAVQSELQEQIRKDMMPWALETFDWQIWAHQWQGWARLDVNCRAQEQDHSLLEAEAVA